MFPQAKIALLFSLLLAFAMWIFAVLFVCLFVGNYDGHFHGINYYSIDNSEVSKTTNGRNSLVQGSMVLFYNC